MAGKKLRDDWKSHFLKRAKAQDLFAKRLITIGGVGVIFTVIGIIALIVNVALPLFYSPNKQLRESAVTASGALSQQILLDPYFDTLTSIDSDGLIRYYPLETADKAGGRARASSVGSYATGQPLRSVEADGDRFTLLATDGSTQFLQISSRPRFEDDGKRSIQRVVRVLASMESEPDEVTKCSMRSTEGQTLRFCLDRQGDLILRTEPAENQEDEFDFGDGDDEALEATVSKIELGANDFLVSSDGIKVIAVFEDRLESLELDYNGTIATRRPSTPYTGAPITAAGFAQGNQSVITGHADGKVGVWFEIDNNTTGLGLHHIRYLPGISQKVDYIYASKRDKTVFAASREGQVRGSFLTSAKSLLELEITDGLRSFVVNPRNSGVAAMGLDGSVQVYDTNFMHPETTFSTLMGKVWYEGYPEPSYVWQSTGGSDAYEPKMSLTPIIFGTLKATLYAMLFALPLSILGAIYTSQFASPRMRNVIKPSIELMASVPSVVIGFLAALWLSPIIQGWTVTLFASLLIFPSILLVFILAWSRIRNHPLLKRWEIGYEFVYLIPVIILATYTATWVAPFAESFFFHSSFSHWLYENTGVRYDQRNSIVIAFALGFTVIPIIFSIADDSLSSVPGDLKAASLALGASRWQTVARVVLPSASPGIFVATMIGLGRAVGETMIVLMATGNTPIMEWNPFNGMRTLSANIAVEVPEAPVGGSLYRTLFLCAVVLFCMTFVLNTGGEIIRQRLREKYGRF